MHVAPALVLACVAAAGCGRDPPPPPPPPATALSPADVVAVREGEIESGPLISGMLAARDTAAVRAEVAGPVRYVGPEVGDAVGAGQVIARIDPKALTEARASARAALASARSQLAVARREHERTQVLVEAGGLARRQLDLARSQVEAAQAQVDQARAQLAATRTQLAEATVRAPIAGVVARRAVAEGDVVSEGTPLYELIDPGTMRLDATVPADALGAIRVGAPVEFEVKGYPDRTFRGEIARIAPAADPQTMQIPILVELPNVSGQLIAGLYAEGRIATRTARGLIVPAAAVTGGDVPAVLAVRGGVLVRVPVEVGVRDELAETVLVRGDLAAGDLVIARAQRAPPVGTRVGVPRPTTPRTAPGT